MKSSIQFTGTDNSEYIITAFQYGSYVFPISINKDGKRFVNQLCNVKTGLKEFLLNCVPNNGEVDIHAVLNDGRKLPLVIKSDLQPFYFEVLFACYSDVERICNAYIDLKNKNLCGW